MKLANEWKILFICFKNHLGNTKLIQQIYLVLYISSVLLGRFSLLDSILQIWFGKFGLIDLVQSQRHKFYLVNSVGYIGLVNRVFQLVIQYQLSNQRLTLVFTASKFYLRWLRYLQKYYSWPWHIWEISWWLASWLVHLVWLNKASKQNSGFQGGLEVLQIYLPG